MHVTPPVSPEGEINNQEVAGQDEIQQGGAGDDGNQDIHTRRKQK